MTRRDRPLCADISRHAGEPLAATASRVEHWILIEYPGLWSRDVLGGSRLAPALKEHLQEQLARLPHSRLLFVRRPQRRRTERRNVYVARTHEHGGDAFGLEIGDYDELRRLDAVAVLDGGGERVVDPLLVVCTHGKRDRCCARYGRPLYDRLRDAVPEEWLWQSTHLGGDRFAGNLVCLPDGLFFGRIDATGAWSVLDEFLAGRIDLEHYRGRSAYTFPQQAAERAVREVTGLRGLADVSLVSSEQAAPRDWTIRFAAAGEVHEIQVTREDGALTYLTCDAPTLKHPRHFVATATRVVRGS
jgi:hypothetical protein